jgi:F420H(2)-dependent quinone reductase
MQNLRHAATARVKVRDREFAARPRELQGEARDAMGRDSILVEAPEVAKYERKAGRTIPVAVLEPQQGGDARPHTPGARE